MLNGYLELELGYVFKEFEYNIPYSIFRLLEFNNSQHSTQTKKYIKPKQSLTYRSENYQIVQMSGKLIKKKIVTKKEHSIWGSQTVNNFTKVNRTKTKLLKKKRKKSKY